MLKRQRRFKVGSKYVITGRTGMMRECLLIAQPEVTPGQKVLIFRADEPRRRKKPA